MRMRLGAPLLAAVVSLLGAVQYAAAGHCGREKHSSSSQPCCDAQSCFTPRQQQCRTTYKLVWDSSLEKRRHTRHQTFQETVPKNADKTFYPGDCRTAANPGY